VAIDGLALRLQLSDGRVLQRRNHANVWNRRHGVNRRRLIRHGDRRRAGDRDHLAALHALGGALLRRADEYRKEQRGEERMNNQRG
jgi:hypothetical protein